MMSIFKKKKKIYEQIEFNKEWLHESLQKIGDSIYVFKQDECMKYFQELFRVSKNLALLEIQRVRNHDELLKANARMEAISDMSDFVERSINKKIIENKEGKKAVPGTLNVFRKVSNQAGSAV